jgi:hypothetical protein
MTLQPLLLAGTIFLLSITAAYAKSYSIDISTPQKVGKLQLQPGPYTLIVEGSNATFRDRHGESQTTTVKVESGTKKFKSTVVESSGDHIEFIDLGGSTTRLQFIE